MSASSMIAPETLQAYFETDYRVLEEPNLVLRIGEPCAHLLAAHQRHAVGCSAFLTAFNPFSQPTSPEINAARQAELVSELERRSLSTLPAIGQHRGNGWPGEESVLVFGLALEAAKVLAMRFEQNAFVWSGADALPQLIVLR